MWKPGVLLVILCFVILFVYFNSPTMLISLETRTISNFILDPPESDFCIFIYFFSQNSVCHVIPFNERFHLIGFQSFLTTNVLLWKYIQHRQLRSLTIFFNKRITFYSPMIRSLCVSLQSFSLLITRKNDFC